VAIAPGISCGACVHCQGGEQNLCRHYGIFGETRDGTNADFICVPAVNALSVSDKLSFEQAAAFPLTFLTAWHMLVARCKVRPGEFVLVHAAGSGVGVAAIQIAKLFGATVAVTASSTMKLDKAAALGADHLINYTTDDFGKRVRELTGKAGADVIVDTIGGETLAKSIASVRKGGRVVTCGATAGYQVTFNIAQVFFKSVSLLGSTMGSGAELREILTHIEAGRLTPVIDTVYAMSEVRTWVPRPKKRVRTVATRRVPSPASHSSSSSPPVSSPWPGRGSNPPQLVHRLVF
jgi:NADPH:quinone reductase-like Zn-dependent oxidoreductase